MAKVTLGPKTLVYPMPVFLVGANVDGKANFMAVAWGGIANGEPPMVSVALRPNRHTLRGVNQNSTFSVNIPSMELMKEADFCGIYSGAKVDKVKACKFNVFYGKLKNVPLIEQCPVNLECSLIQKVNLGSHILCIGRVEEVYASDNYLTDGKPDVSKIKPLIYVTEPERCYWSYGGFIAKSHSIGKEIKAE